MADLKKMFTKYCVILAVSFLVIESAPAQINIKSFHRAVGRDSSKTGAKDAWVGRDKYSHLTVSAFLVGAQFFVLKEFADWEATNARNAAVASTAIIGIAKEIYDHVSKKGQPSLKDIGADFLGAGLTVLMLRTN